MVRSLFEAGMTSFEPASVMEFGFNMNDYMLFGDQDEYGTAAYKTVELDTYLDDKPIQHREVEGHESELFLSYFRAGIM